MRNCFHIWKPSKPFVFTLPTMTRMPKTWYGTYLKAHKFIDRYVEGTNAKAWLFKILKNAYINEYRKKSKRPTKVNYEDIVTYQDSEDGQLIHTAPGDCRICGRFVQRPNGRRGHHRPQLIASRF